MNSGIGPSVLTFLRGNSIPSSKTSLTDPLLGWFKAPVKITSRHPFAIVRYVAAAVLRESVRIKHDLSGNPDGLLYSAHIHTDTVGNYR